MSCRYGIMTGHIQFDIAEDTCRKSNAVEKGHVISRTDMSILKQIVTTKGNIDGNYSRMFFLLLLLTAYLTNGVTKGISIPSEPWFRQCIKLGSSFVRQYSVGSCCCGGCVGCVGGGCHLNFMKKGGHSYRVILHFTVDSVVGVVGRKRRRRRRRRMMILFVVMTQ